MDEKQKGVILAVLFKVKECIASSLGFPLPNSWAKMAAPANQRLMSKDSLKYHENRAKQITKSLFDAGLLAKELLPATKGKKS